MLSNLHKTDRNCHLRKMHTNKHLSTHIYTHTKWLMKIG